MIVGTITLISMLFFGGVQEYFLLDKLEKGTKTYIVDKDKRKEILSDIRQSKNLIEQFNKQRQTKIKILKRLNSDRNTTTETLNKFFLDIQTERTEFQQSLIHDRLAVTKKFSQEEWENIIQLSSSSAEKRIQKESIKAKDPFKAIADQINETMAGTGKAEEAIAILEDFKLDFNVMNDKVISINASENEIIQKRDATYEELMQIAKEMNEVRHETFGALINFHFEMREVTSADEWNKIMKEFSKIMN